MPVARLSARNLVRRYPLLATKFYVPQPPPENVSRLQLIEQLNHEARRPLTLVTAPAGFGKTSLLTAGPRAFAARGAYHAAAVARRHPRGAI